MQFNVFNVFIVPNQPDVSLDQGTTSITVIITKPPGGVDFYTVRCVSGTGCPGPRVSNTVTTAYLELGVLGFYLRVCPADKYAVN